MGQVRFNLICLGLFFAAGAWGLYWLPQRALESAGLTGGWSTIAQFSVCVVFLTPIAVWRRSKGLQTGIDLPLVGLLMGGGAACYANSFLLTDVIRALILFYLTPLWATLFETALKRKLPGWQRAISLPLSLFGVWVVIGQEVGIPLPQNTGDWLAVLAGAMFAGGATRIETLDTEGIFPVLFAFFVYGGIIAAFQGYLLADLVGSIPTMETWVQLAPWFVLLSLGFFIPTNIMITWAPSQIGAGLFSILILSELVFGTISAALLADEAFGWRELVGSVLILTAGLVEVVLSPKAQEVEGSLS